VIESTASANSPTSSAVLTEDQWVTIPGGPFTMGADDVREDGKPLAAYPAHQVDVATFRIARHPVTVSDFARFVDETGYTTFAERAGRSWVWIGGEDTTTPDQDHLWIQIDGTSWRHPRGPASDVADKADHPVTHVVLEDCLAYCDWSGTRLPTEAAWEKTARGTDARVYPWGNTPPTPTVCNHSMFTGDTTPVGRFPDAAGPYGVDDIVGNVWEWTSSGWHPYPFAEDRPARTITTRFGTFKLGVIRGASFYNNCSPGGCAAWVRVYSHPEYSCYDIGFRVCAA